MFIERYRRGWTQAQLAAAAGLYPSDISAIERGRRDPGLTIQRRLSDALEITLGELVSLAEREEEGERGSSPPNLQKSGRLRKQRARKGEGRPV